MLELSDTFHDLYTKAVEEDYESGAYKDINYDKALVWHEFSNGTWETSYISLIDMLSRMATLTSSVASNGASVDEDTLSLLRNGVTEALISFNETVTIY
jgi:gamma-glutamyltranspeptidase